MRRPQDSYVASQDNVVEAFLILLSSAVNISPSNSLPVQNLTMIKTLSIQCSSCIHFTAEPSLFFKKFVELKKLIINGLCIESQAISIISHTIPESLCSLKVLNLSNCQLDSNDTVTLLSPCKSATLLQLTVLDLSHNKIEDHAIYLVIELLLQIPRLVTAKFEGNPLSDISLLAINHITTDFNSCISTIDYNDNADKDIYISSMFTILSSMKDVSDKRSYQVKNILTVNKTMIQILNQKEPMVMSGDVLVFFCRFANLQTLNLNGIYITSATDASALKSYASLHTLIMKRCRIDSNLITAIMSSLCKDELREMCLSQIENINQQAQGWRNRSGRPGSCRTNNLQRNYKNKELSQEYFLIECSYCLIVYAYNYLFTFTD